jgi:hypothetical protein
MLTAPLPSTSRAPDAGRAPPEALARDEGPAPGLSNDYLNSYSEALMLLEMASHDPGLAEELAAWRPVGYRAYFAASTLRRAPAALAAYDRLPAEARAAFEELTEAMDRLALTAIAALRPPCSPEEAARVADATAPTLRRLIDQAAGFLNSGGRRLPRDGEVEAAQGAIDRLLERAGGEAGGAD